MYQDILKQLEVGKQTEVNHYVERLWLVLFASDKSQYMSHCETNKGWFRCEDTPAVRWPDGRQRSLVVQHLQWLCTSLEQRQADLPVPLPLGSVIRPGKILVQGFGSSESQATLLRDMTESRNIGKASKATNKAIQLLGDVRGDLEAAFAKLDEGEWIEGSMADKYWQPRERQEVANQQQFMKALYRAGLGSMQAYDDWTGSAVHEKREMYPLLEKERHKADMEGVACASCCSNAENKCGLYDVFMNLTIETGTCSLQNDKQMKMPLAHRARQRVQQCWFFHLHKTCGPPTSTAPFTRRFSTSLKTNFGDIADSFPNTTILFIGDSISHQAFEAAACSLNRHGFTEMIRDCPAAAGQTDLCQHSNPGVVCCASFTRLSTAAHREGTIRLCFSWDPQMQFMKAEILADVDVVLFNAGLWFDNLSTKKQIAKYKSCIERATSLITEWKARSPHEDRIAIFRGNTPQHFEGFTDGRFPSKQAQQNSSTADNTHLCVPHTNASAASELDEFTRRVFRELGVVKNGPAQVYFLPVYRALAGRYDAHRGSWLPSETIADCTHWCWYPLMWEVLWDRLHLVLLHHADQHTVA
jgi:hypothetical protein